MPKGIFTPSKKTEDSDIPSETLMRSHGVTINGRYSYHPRFGTGICHYLNFRTVNVTEGNLAVAV